jgi:hypothetical protein
VPGDYQQEAEARGISIHKLLEDEALFDKLDSQYVRQYDCFGRGENNVMKTLKKIEAETLLGHK